MGATSRSASMSSPRHDGLYTIRRIPSGFRVIKFDDLFNVVTEYELIQRSWGLQCACFAANKETCRHREMAALFIRLNRVDKGWFYNYGARLWVKPIRL